MKFRTSYPVLPWIGIIAIGYACGPLFSRNITLAKRQSILIVGGISSIGAFFILRFINGYGEKHWQVGETISQTLMSFLNITKYPPSLAFILITLGIGSLIMALFEHYNHLKVIYWLSIFGSVPMFFYILHLYVLKVLYILCSSIWGLNQGAYFGFDSISSIWACTIILVLVLYYLVHAFSQFKARRRDITWLKYF